MTEEEKTPPRAPKHASHGGGSGHQQQHEDHDEGEHGGAPEWLISFADNTALLMGFFVIMLALNMAPKSSGAPSASDSESQAAKEAGQSAEALDWAIGVRAAFNNPVNVNSTDPRDRVLVMRLRERANRGQANDKGVDGTFDQSQSLKNGNFFNDVAVIPFETRSANLSSAASEILELTAQRMRGTKLQIDIRGHASAAEITSDDAYPAKLSFERALAVANALVKLGIERKQLRLVACGNAELLQHRIYKTPEHAVNTRVEIILTDRLVEP